MAFGPSFDDAAYKIAWPTSLESLVLDRDFDQKINGVVWPVALKRLKSGDNFDRNVNAVPGPVYGRFSRLVID